MYVVYLKFKWPLWSSYVFLRYSNLEVRKSREEEMRHSNNFFIRKIYMGVFSTLSNI